MKLRCLLALLLGVMLSGAAVAAPAANYYWNGTAWVLIAGLLRGANSATGTAATTFTGMGAQGAGFKIYVTGVQFFRTDAGATSSYVTLNDSASTVVMLPAGGGSNVVFATPLMVAANTAFQFTPHDSLTTVFGNAQGFSGP
jgi:hypothetical protein